MDPVVRSLFHELADLSQTEREAAFAREGVSPEIRAEVESLLSFDSTDTRGRLRFGSYRAIRLLGTGGMGAVYLADRTDGEIAQKAAVKVLRTDIQRPAWRERFLRERQLLAYLNHPSIVHLIDAGHTNEGQPYLIMEYVDGTPIDECAAKMELRERLLLFLRVCEGVSHAHQRLIIHRDLKPSNILVDVSGQPKILDFGIAKLIDDSMDRTQTIDRLLTPNYASPEQLRGEPTTTATDVYSLGAVLRKILTGHPPNEPVDVKPPLPADIEYILRKALRAEPEERYASVEAFANDIHAFLEWRPLQARSADAWYRTRKFLRRYWVPVTAASVVVVVLSIALYAVNRERQIAQRRFDQVRQLSNKVLALDNVLNGLPGSTKARSEIISMSKDYLESLTAEGRPTKELGLELANAFLTLARSQGVPPAANLGQHAEAEVSLSKADHLTEEVLAASPREPKALWLSANINRDRMILADADRHRDLELRFAQTTGNRIEAFLANGPLSDSEKRDALLVLTNIALAYKNLDQYPESIHYGRRTAELGQSLPDAQASVSQALSIVADSMRYSGDLEGALRTIEQAVAIVKQATFPSETARMKTLHNVLWRQASILGAASQISLMRPDEAIVVFQQAYDMIEEGAKRDANDASFRILFEQDARELERLLHDRDPDRALALVDHAIQRLREIKNNSEARRHEARLLAASSYPLGRLSRVNEARQRIDKAFNLLRETEAYPAAAFEIDDDAASVTRALGDHLADTNQPQAAAAAYRELLEKVRASHTDPDTDLRYATPFSDIYQALARLCVRNGDSEQAMALSQRRLKLWQDWNRKLPHNNFIQYELKAASAP